MRLREQNFLQKPYIHYKVDTFAYTCSLRIVHRESIHGQIASSLTDPRIPAVLQLVVVQRIIEFVYFHEVTPIVIVVALVFPVKTHEVDVNGGG